MKKLIPLILLLSVFLLSFIDLSKIESTIEIPVYTKNDLGVNYSPNHTRFKIWAPAATYIKLRLYKTGEGGLALKTIDLSKVELGTWETTIYGDFQNFYYTFQTYQKGKWSLECPDLYAKAVGINGKRGMIVDLVATNPKGWNHDHKPLLKSFTDIIIYELHIRDLSTSLNSGILNKGKFLGLAETGTHSPDGESTGLDHIKQLGVTHIHLLPCFDFKSDEKVKVDKYNWGYDPLNYNVPEGSYSTNAYDGRIRIKEFKTLVKTLHDNGLRVIMDVVYNHTSDIENSNFTQFEPGYFYRHNLDGSYSNGTACGNETASEKTMMRKFMVESVAYWAHEYHIDGFRFDLMGIHDLITMNAISDTLHKIDSSIFIYGEGWAAGNSPLDINLRAVKKNVFKLNKIAAFSDDIRDGLHGGFNDVKSKGFVSGFTGTAESVKFGIVASTMHPQVNYNLVNYSKAPWAKEPYQTISYVSCHDDNSLLDRLKISNPNVSDSVIINMDKFANAIVFTSQGVPFLLAGEEMLRTKHGVANSFNSPDSINELDWSRKTKYNYVNNYYQGLITLRKNHPAFRMPSTGLIQKHLEFIETHDPLLIEYQLIGNANGDKWKTILVLLNGNLGTKTVKLPAGNWTLAVDQERIKESGIIKHLSSSITLPSTSAFVLFQL